MNKENVEETGPEGRWTLLAPHTELDRDPATWQVLRVVGPRLERESVEVVAAASPSTQELTEREVRALVNAGVCRGDDYWRAIDKLRSCLSGEPSR